MQRIVVGKNEDIFDYVVDFAIKQHNQPEEHCPFPEKWNIFKNRYTIIFSRSNRKDYERFKEKFNCDLEESGGEQVLNWRKNNDEIQMSVTYEYRYLVVNYIVVNDEPVYKCGGPRLIEAEEDGKYQFGY